MSSHRHVLLRYAGVVLSTALAVVVTHLLRRWHIPGIFPSFFGAVVLASWIAGFGGALLSTGLSTFAISYWFLPPVRSWTLQPNSLISLGLFILLALFVAAVSTKITGIDSLLSGALTSIEDAVLVTDVRGRVTFVNDLAERLTGWPAAETKKVASNRIFLLSDIASGERLTDLVASALKDGQAATLAEGLVLTSRTGNCVAIEGSLSPIRDRAGRLRGVIVLFRDVTDRRRAVEALQCTTATLSALVSTAPLAIWTIDLEGKVLLWNPAAEKMFGWSQTEIQGRPLPVIPEEQQLDFQEWLARYRQGESLLGAERLLRRKSGALVWTNTWEVPLRDGMGSVTGTLCLVLDISERKRAEQALLQSRAQLERSQRIAQLGSWERAVASRELSWSEETYRIFGLPAGQPVTLDRFLELVHPQDRERVLAVAQEALRTRTPYGVEHRIIRPDGSERTVQEQAEVIVDRESGQSMRLVGTAQDITERRRLEDQFRQAQKMEAVGRLAGGVAHDFNNLLTVISCYADLLGAQLSAGGTGREAIEEIRKAADRASVLTQQLLAVSRRQVFEPRTLNLNPVVVNMENMLRRLIGEDVGLVTRLGQDLWAVNGDVGQLEQVIMNLAVNARDAMPRGGTLTIETANVELDEAYAVGHVDVRSGNYVLLAVSDTGTGMTTEVQARLFEPFFTTKEKGRGTGLGLSTAYGIVKQSGGHIGVYSEPGRGSTFKVYLPQAINLLASPAVHSAQASAVVSPKTILVVEDEDSVRKLTCKILEENGHQVLAAANGAEALAISIEFRETVQVLVSDLVLPDMNGCDLAREVQRQIPGIAVLFVSGYTEHAAANQQEFIAEAQFLQKPFTPSRLLSKVQEVLGR